MELTFQMTGSGGSTSITIPINELETKAYNASTTWSVDTSLYKITGAKLRFWTEGYYKIKYIYDSAGYTSGSYTGYKNQDTVEISLAAAVTEGRTGGLLTATLQRQSRYRAIYRDIYLVIEVEELTVEVESTALIGEAAVGELQSVTLINDSDTVTHTVRWQYGTADSGVKAYGAANRTVAWAVPADQVEALIRAYPDSDTIPGTVTVETLKADGTSLGSTPYNTSLRITAAQAGPAITLAETARTQDSVTAGRSDVVQGHTTLTLTPTVSLQLGATLRSIRWTTPDGGSEASTAQAVTWTPEKAGEATVRALVTDSRGMTAAANLTWTVKAYAPPVLTRVEAWRSDAGGAETDEGAWIHVEAEATVSSLTTLESIQARIKTVGGTVVVPWSALSAGAANLGSSLRGDLSYVVEIKATDALGQTGEASVAVASALYTIHRLRGGKGICFGRAASRMGVEVREDWPFYAHGEELLELTINAAHPPGSLLETIDGDFDPNTAWPWTEWGKIGTRSMGDMGTHVWVRAR